MKVFNNPNVQRVMAGYGVKPGRVDKAEGVKAASDKIEISDASKDFGVAMKALKDLPDVREDKVRKLKELIGSGNYNVSGEDIADKMISDVKINLLG